MKWFSSAPANIMLMGEHSVVYGQPALLAALTPTINITWQARTDRKLVIHSALAGFETQLDSINDHPNLRFVLQAVRSFPVQLDFGVTLKIDSEFPADWGLGSSAAVLAATLIGLQHITQTKLSSWQLFELGHQCILTIQGRGSGADLAASLNGGLTYFDPSQRLIENLEGTLDISLVYSGYKTPTAQVLAWVAEHWQSRPTELYALYQKMGDSTRQAYQALKTQDTAQFHQQVLCYQDYMHQLGVSDAVLDEILSLLKQQNQVAKISGSGLGDCVIAFGHIEQLADYAIWPSRINPQGASSRSI